MAINFDLVTADALMSLDFETLLSRVEVRDCFSYGNALSQLAQDEAKWSPAQLESIRFVAALLMMGLRAEDANQPYGPMFEFGGSRSFIPDDFSKEFLSPLVDWIDGLTDPELRCRLFDVVWLRLRSRSAVEKSVEAYVASALRLENPQRWPPSVERLERALRLAASLGRGGVELKNHVLSEIDAMLKRHQGLAPSYLTFRLIKLLLEFRSGDIQELASYALVAAERAIERSDFWLSKDYFELLADCLRRKGDTDAANKAKERAAEALVFEAKLAQKDGRGSIAAASILSDAVEAMRQVPSCKARAAELHDELLHLQRLAVTHLKSISSEGIDISEIATKAMNSVRDKELVDAVSIFCRLITPPLIEKLKRDVHADAKEAVLANILTTEVMDSQGRVIARAPALQPGADDLKDGGLRWRMFCKGRKIRELSVHGILNPARQEIINSHQPDREDILALVQYSPWIPRGHLESVVRGLIAGFRGDMLVAAHIIPTQMEALIRHVVKINGGATSMLEPGGLQPERPLSALLETDQAKAAFGEDQIFELQDLLVDPLGTNLRNEVAHGILDDDGIFGSEVMFVWWLMLKFCVFTSKIAERSQLKDSSSNKHPLII